MYEVSRSLLEQHLDTMLARMASDTWLHVGNVNENRSKKRNNNNEGSKLAGEEEHNDNGDVMGDKSALFIERNGDRFQFCLDYMRDGGNIDLPVTVSKDSLLQDLVYYGFHNVDPSRITVKGSLPLLRTSRDHIDSLCDSLRKDVEEKVGKIRKIQNSTELMLLFLERYKTNASLEFRISKRHHLYQFAKTLENDDRTRSQFILDLDRINLKCKSITVTCNCVTIQLEFL